MKDDKGFRPTRDHGADAALRPSVAALVREHEARSGWLRALEEKLRAVRADMLVYQAPPRC